MADRGLLHTHSSLVDAARSDIGADWAALVDGDGRVLMARLPPGAPPAPRRPAAWRSAGEHLALVPTRGGSTLALGRSSPIDREERLRLRALVSAVGEGTGTDGGPFGPGGG
jgi:hypothetical protein